MGKRFRLGPHIVGNHMPVANQAILIDDQSLQANRATCVCFIRADANFGAFAKAKAIGKAR